MNVSYSPAASPMETLKVVKRPSSIAVKSNYWEIYQQRVVGYVQRWSKPRGNRPEGSVVEPTIIDTIYNAIPDQSAFVSQSSIIQQTLAALSSRFTTLSEQTHYSLSHIITQWVEWCNGMEEACSKLNNVGVQGLLECQEGERKLEEIMDWMGGVVEKHAKLDSLGTLSLISIVDFRFSHISNTYYFKIKSKCSSPISISIKDMSDTICVQSKIIHPKAISKVFTSPTYAVATATCKFTICNAAGQTAPNSTEFHWYPVRILSVTTEEQGLYHVHVKNKSHFGLEDLGIMSPEDHLRLDKSQITLTPNQIGFVPVSMDHEPLKKRETFMLRAFADQFGYLSKPFEYMLNLVEMSASTYVDYLEPNVLDIFKRILRETRFPGSQDVGEAVYRSVVVKENYDEAKDMLSSTIEFRDRW